MKRRIPVLLATLLICALVVAPALAVPPEQIDFPYLHFGPFPFATCPDFQVMSEVVQGGTGNVYFDQAGNPVKWIIKADSETTLYSALNPEKKLVASGHWMWITDEWSAGGKQVGPIIHLVVPGMGTVFLDAGQVIFVTPTGPVKVVGTHPMYDPDDLNLDRLCAALE